VRQKRVPGMPGLWRVGFRARRGRLLGVGWTEVTKNESAWPHAPHQATQVEARGQAHNFLMVSNTNGLKD
jgi:hypothetical protein